MDEAGKKRSGASMLTLPHMELAIGIEKLHRGQRNLKISVDFLDLDNILILCSINRIVLMQ